MVLQTASAPPIQSLGDLRASAATSRPLRIGIMLRHLGQHGGGVHVYTHNLLRELAGLDTRHEFFLFYSHPRFLGRFAGRPNVHETAVRAPSVLLWDQAVARHLAHRERVDLLFNPKYSVPLACERPSAWVCHGLDWYVMPWASRWIDRLSHRLLVPRYARESARILCVSDTTREHVRRYLDVPDSRTETVYLGVDEAFREMWPVARLEAVRLKHRLPKRFFLFCGQIYPPKNFGRLVRAYARVGPGLGIHLVIAGEHRWLARQDLLEIERLGLSSWIHRAGWIERETLPAFYQLSRALLSPSLYESFSIPLLEAMASGCPVLTADRYGCGEIAGSAGVLVDPESEDCIAEGIHRIATDPELRARNVAAGIERSAQFSWKRCAQQTLAALERALQPAADMPPASGADRALRAGNRR